MTFINFDSTTISKIQRLANEGFWVFIGQAGSAITGLIGLKILTHLLTPSEFGRLALVNTIIALLGTIFLVLSAKDSTVFGQSVKKGGI